jgi:hypothetical protein
MFPGWKSRLLPPITEFHKDTGLPVRHPSIRTCRATRVQGFSDPKYHNVGKAADAWEGYMRALALVDWDSSRYVRDDYCERNKDKIASARNVEHVSQREAQRISVKKFCT